MVMLCTLLNRRMLVHLAIPVTVHCTVNTPGDWMVLHYSEVDFVSILYDRIYIHDIVH